MNRTLLVVLTIGATVFGVSAYAHHSFPATYLVDDTMTIAATAPVGAVDKVAMIDASGDDIFIVGDTISMSGDGGTASGAAFFWLEVRTYVMQVA